MYKGKKGNKYIGRENEYINAYAENDTIKSINQQYFSVRGSKEAGFKLTERYAYFFYSGKDIASEKCSYDPPLPLQTFI